jgi:4'-phosphopantetheinyl transferase
MIGITTLGASGNDAEAWSELAADEVRIWAVSLLVTESACADVKASLTAEEQQRAERYLRREIGRRFVVARAALRGILGACLGLSPSAVPIETDSLGKPRLAAGANDGELSFNLAHSGELALVALTRGCEVGIDVEQIRSIDHWQEIAENYFHPAEIAQIAASEPSHHVAAFLQCWTRKEAILKAAGVGLSHSLKSFAAGMADQSGRWTELPENGVADGDRYWVQSLVPTAGYVAAVATSLPRQTQMDAYANS